jgi:hypothetical protein
MGPISPTLANAGSKAEIGSAKGISVAVESKRAAIKVSRGVATIG